MQRKKEFSDAKVMHAEWNKVNKITNLEFIIDIVGGLLINHVNESTGNEQHGTPYFFLCK